MASPVHAVSDALRTKAYVVPFAVFMGFVLLWQFGAPMLEWDHPAAAWWRRAPEQWIYPVQALTCFALVLWWRRAIAWDWQWKASLWGGVFGVLGILFWLAPTMLADRLPGGADAWFGNPSWPWHRYLLGIDARPEGFNPAEVFAHDGWGWWMALVWRFFRAVVVVALVEELFWRGYLMRLLVNPDHPWKVSFGAHSWKAYWVTTLCFMVVHQPVDYCGAFIYGSLAYLLAVKSKNLCAVIVMHAVANALLGWAALQWGKYGLW